MRVTSEFGTIYGQIFKNGVAFGTLRQTTSYDYVVYTEDVNISAGDTIQVYLWGNTSVTGFGNNLIQYGLSSVAAPQYSIQP